MTTQTKQLIQDFSECKTMPVFMAKDKGDVLPQIRYYLKRLVDWEIEVDSRKKAVLPSATCIAEHCTCTVVDIKKALKDLEKEGYSVQYEDETSVITVC